MYFRQYEIATAFCLACFFGLCRSARVSRETRSRICDGCPDSDEAGGEDVPKILGERLQVRGASHPLTEFASLLMSHRTPNLLNFRTVGGSPAVDGRIMRSDKLYRCACPANASAEDADIVLRDLGVKTVLDVRGEDQAMKDIGPRRLAPITQYLSLLPKSMMAKAMSKHLLEEDKRGLMKLALFAVMEKALPSRRLRQKFGGKLNAKLADVLDIFSLPDTYWLMVTQRGREIREAAEMCASSETLPMLVHCTHGKDRTGVVIAMLLSACGVSEDEILNDYVLSHDYGCSTEGREAMRLALPERVRFELSDETFDSWCEAPEDVLRDLFSRIRKEYGSVDAYLDSIGINASLRARLVEQLTEPA